MMTLGVFCGTVRSSTIGYWRFEGLDDATGFLLDSSVNGHTLSRSVASGVPQVVLPASGAGSAFPSLIEQTGAANSSAASFTTASTNGFLSAAYDPSFLADSFTIEAFISPSALSANTVAVGQFSTTGDPQRRWFLGPTSGSQLRVALASAPTSAPVLDTNANNWVGPSGTVPTSLTVGNDYYVAASVTLATGGAGTGEVTYYLKNLTTGGPLLTQTRTHSVESLHPSTANLSIGAMANSTAGGSPFPGLIDEVRFSSGVLSSDQLLVPSAPSTRVTETYSYQSSVTPGVTNLKAELNYDSAQSGAPIAVVMHGFSPASGNFASYRANAERLRSQGFFVLTVAMRGRDGSDGARDSGGVEIHDIYDAVEAVVADSQYASMVDGTSVYVSGYSGGGGNVMSALTKFPDYFRAGAAFFGMSDYGYDTTDGWWFNGSSSSHRTILANDVGNPQTGGPTVVDRYMARASNLASKNNPYSEIHLFVNSNETTCPPINSTSFRDNAIAAASYAGEFDNITVHLGQAGTYYDFNGDSINQPNEQQYWPHNAPTADQQAAAEQWFLAQLLAGQIARPELNDTDTLFVAGYVKTRKFDLWLGDGQNAAAELDYSLTDQQMQFELDLLTSDPTVTGVLNVDTSRMGGVAVNVLLNGQQVDSFAGGGWYQYTGLGNGDLLLLQAVPEPSSLILLGLAAAASLLLRRRH